MHWLVPNNVKTNEKCLAACCLGQGAGVCLLVSITWPGQLCWLEDMKHRQLGSVPC